MVTKNSMVIMVNLLLSFCTLYSFTIPVCNNFKIQYAILLILVVCDVLYTWLLCEAYNPFKLVFSLPQEHQQGGSHAPITNFPKNLSY